MDASTSSHGSYVLVHSTSHAHSLDRYFPLVAQPSHFTSHLDHSSHLGQHRRLQPDSNLFIDHLLQLALPHSSISYPPTSHADLSSLLSALSTAPLNPLTARSCLYYLALSLSTPQLAAAYAQDHLLPTAFRLSVRAFHALDTANYQLGVKLLSDPRVTPDFIPRTFALLDSVPEPRDRAQLVLSYWRLAGIKLEEQSKDEVKVVIRALCADGRKYGANEAWLLAREWHVEAERAELTKAVLATCFGDNPSRLPIAQHLSTLLSRPFTPSEDALATSFCASPPASLNPTLTADWRLSKLIAESRPVDALRLWATVKRNGNKRVEPSDQRDRLLAAVEANLTTIQKTTLSLETSSAPTPSAAPSNASSAPSAAANITQPAWAPLPTPSAIPSTTPAALPRTLAAARLAHLPAPPPPQPRAEDLPLSSSPFVRGPTAGGVGAGASGVLRALEAATPRKTTQPGFAASPATATGLGMGRASAFVFPPPSTAGSTAGGGGGSAPSTAGGSVVDFSAAAAGSPASKPTLAGFGSVRQMPPPALLQQATPKAKQTPKRFVQQQQEEEDEYEDKDGDAPMAVDHEEDDEEDYAFAARAARDPAIAATIAAAASQPQPPPQPAPPSSTASLQAKTPTKPLSKRVAGAASARSTRTRERGDKRRAVIVELEQTQSGLGEEEEEGEEKEGEKAKGRGKGKTPASKSRGGRTSGRRAPAASNSGVGRDRPDAGKTVKLPPGAFPGEEDDEEDDSGREREGQATPPGPATRRSSRASTASQQQQQQLQQQKTPARRSTRSRQSTVDPPSPAESTTSTVSRATATRRRSARAGSVALSEAGEKEQEGAEGEEGEEEEAQEKKKATTQTARRSSRRSTASTAGGTAGGTAGAATPATRRSTRRRAGTIEEEEE